MRTRIKICGLVRPQDVDASVRAGADAVGFVLWSRSPRAVTLAEAAALRRRLPSFVSAVGLFVNAEPAEVAEAVRVAGFDVVQLHGDETPAQCDAVARAVNVPWWRAVGMKSEGDLLESARLYGAAEALVLDTHSDGYGGSGRTFDWRWARADVPVRRLLSGGLSPENVAEAVRAVRPFGVDVSSGVQRGAEKREKDAERIERFVAEVLAADAALGGDAGPTAGGVQGAEAAPNAAGGEASPSH